MASDEGSSPDISSETHFIPQEGDDEVLWKVIEITAENKKNYKVRWEGIDPDTGKPWAQSWVSKHDCTDDLVVAWKRSQALNRRQRGSKKSTLPINVTHLR